MSNYFGPAKIGIARFIVHKFELEPEEKKRFPWRRGIEILEQDAFDDGFISQRFKHGPMDMAKETIGESDGEEQMSEILKDQPEGFYEIVGDLHYEFDPGYDSPNGPAEADSWWWLENARTAKLSEEQTKWFLPEEPQEQHHVWCNYQSGEVDKCRQCADLKKRFPMGDLSEAELREKHFPDAIART